MGRDHASDAAHAEWHPPEALPAEKQSTPVRRLEVVPPVPQEGSLEAQTGLAKIIAGMVAEIPGLRISESGKLQEPLNAEITYDDITRMRELQKILNKFLADKNISFPPELAVNPDYATVDDDGQAEIGRARARADLAADNK
jgi:hypothetical protein